VFIHWALGKLLESNELNIPGPRVLLSDAEVFSVPFVLVGDGPFALSQMCYGYIPPKI